MNYRKPAAGAADAAKYAEAFLETLRAASAVFVVDIDELGAHTTDSALRAAAELLEAHERTITDALKLLRRRLVQVGTGTPNGLSLDIVDVVVGKQFSVMPQKIRKGRREAGKLLPVWAAVDVAFTLTTHSSNVIARHYGYAHHTSAQYAARQVVKRSKEGALPYDRVTLLADAAGALMQAVDARVIRRCNVG